MNELLLNQQDYIADRCLISDSWVKEISKIALYKIQTWNKACAAPEEHHHQKEIRELIEEAFFAFVPPGFVLCEEGYYFSQTEN